MVRFEYMFYVPKTELNEWSRRYNFVRKFKVQLIAQFASSLRARLNANFVNNLWALGSVLQTGIVGRLGMTF